MGVQIAQAAEILGISKDAVRQKIRRGTLEAEKLDGIWYVILDDVQDTPSEAHAALSSSVRDADSILYSTDVQEAYKARIDDLLHQVDFLQDQIKEKDEQLKAKDEQIAKKDEQIQTVNYTLLEWSRRLPEPAVISGPTQKKWWQFWIR